MLNTFKLLLKILRSCLFRKILVLGRRVACLPELTTFLHLLINLGKQYHDKQKLARLEGSSLAALVGSPFFDDGVILLTGATFLHKNTVLPSRVNLVKARQSQHALAPFWTIRACAGALLARKKGSPFFLM